MSASLWADKRDEQLKRHQEFDKNLSHNLQKIAELNEQNSKTYLRFISKINARLENANRSLFEESEKKFLHSSEQFLLAKYGAMNLQSNPMRGLCYVQDQEAWRAYRIKFLGEMLDPKTGFLTPCQKSINKIETLTSENAKLLSELAKNGLTLHHHLLDYVDKTDHFLKSLKKETSICRLEQKNITLKFYLSTLLEWEDQIKDKHLCLLK